VASRRDYFCVDLAVIVKAPRDKPVASRRDYFCVDLAVIVKAPRDKPVASCIENDPR